MKKIVFDIETRNSFAEVGSHDPRALDLALLVIYDYQDNSYSSYLQEDLHKLWPILEAADLLIGFNSDYFDIPLLNKYYPGDLTKIKSLDILAEIKKSIGKRISLDAVAGGTLGTAKSSHGLQAVEWWKQGEIENIRKYCQDDVKITKDVYDYALANGRLGYKVVNDVKEFAIDTSGWEDFKASGINLTLPF